MTIRMQLESCKLQLPTMRRRYIGNNQVLTLSEVITNVDVIGNHNTLTVGINKATIKVIGNACSVKVHQGCGKIQVVGNSSTVLIGSGIDAHCVHCVGNNNRVFSESDWSETSDTLADSNLSEDDCNSGNTGNGIFENRKQSTKRPMSSASNGTCGSYQSDGGDGNTKGGSCDCVREARHVNGLLDCLDNDTIAFKQGNLYIDNCVSLRVARARRF